MVEPMKPRKRRRWLSLSLRALLLMMLLIAVGSGYLGIQMSRLRRQRAAISKVLSVGGNVTYYHTPDSIGGFGGPLFGSFGEKPAPNPGPQSVRRWLGDDYFVKVKSLSDVNLGLGDDKQKIASLDFVRDLPDLKQISLYKADRIKDISALSHLNLNGLTLLGAKINDLDSLTGMKNLQAVDLDESSVQNVQAIEGLKQLQYLSLANTKVATLPELKHHRSLEHLDLTATRIHDLEFLRSTSSLTALWIAKTAVRDLSPIRSNQELESLDCTHTKVADLSALQQLTKLSELKLGHSKVADLRPLAQLKTLTELVLEGTRVRDATPVKNLELLFALTLKNAPVTAISIPKDLSYLDISGTEITSLQFVKKDTALATLVMDRTPIVDLAPLHACSLGLGHTKIRDLSALIKTKGIDEVWIAPGCVSEKELQRFRKARPEIELIIQEDPPDWSGWRNWVIPGSIEPVVG